MIGSKSASRTERDKAQSRLEELGEAEKKLGSGICPFLQEDCENLSGGRNAEAYFSQRTEELKTYIDEKNEEIKDLEALEKEKMTLEKSLHLQLEERKKQQELQSKLDYLKNQKEKSEKDKENFILKLSASAQQFGFPEGFSGEDFEPLDRLVLSKGHGGPVLYVALAYRGFRETRPPEDHAAHPPRPSGATSPPRPVEPAPPHGIDPALTLDPFRKRAP